MADQGPANRFGDRQVAELGQQVVAAAKAMARGAPAASPLTSTSSVLTGPGDIQRD